MGEKTSLGYVFGAACLIAILAACIFYGIAGPDFLGFKLLLGVPWTLAATFFVVWPLLTYIHLFLLRRAGLRGFYKVRTWVAIPMFYVGAAAGWELVRDTYQNSEMGARHHRQRLERMEDQLAGNVFLYQEPLSKTEEDALVWFIEDRTISPRFATDMARHYSHSFYGLFTLANVTKTPPEGLRAVYAVAQALPNNQEIFKALAENPGTPLDILEDMMHSGAKHLERFAFRSPRLPKSEKIDFLSRASISNSASDRALAASEGDTPVSALRKLATDRDPGVILGLIGNPCTPEDVLQRFTRSEYAAFRSGAESQLVRRRESQAATR
jgi:hypothetical protein